MAITPNEAKALVKKRHAQDRRDSEDSRPIREEKERVEIQETLDSMESLFDIKVTEAATEGKPSVNLFSFDTSFGRDLMEKAGKLLKVIHPGFRYVVCSRRGIHPGQGDDGSTWIAVYWDNLESFHSPTGPDLNRIYDPKIL